MLKLYWCILESPSL